MTIGIRFVLTTLSLFFLAAPAGAQEDAPQGRKKRMTMEESLLLPSWGSYGLSPDHSKLVFTKREMDPEEWEGVTHIWINWSELARLHATYGYDPEVTWNRMRRLAVSGLRPVRDYQQLRTLFALPATPAQETTGS